MQMLFKEISIEFSGTAALFWTPKLYVLTLSIVKRCYNYKINKSQNNYNEGTVMSH